MKFDSNSDFFDSEMVKKSLRDIHELQDLVTMNILGAAGFTDEYDDEDELDQLDMVEELLEKQELMYIRCKLSDDPDAQLVAENMSDQLRSMGMPRGTSVEQIFENLKGSIRKLKETLDN
tara:strand:+ start:57 stop:416 length:360 start_codon:yes stop_codon:yes gene_type:complete